MVTFWWKMRIGKKLLLSPARWANKHRYKESVNDLSHFCCQLRPNNLMFCFSLAAKRCCGALLFSNLENNIQTKCSGGCSFTSWRLFQRWRRLLLCQVPSSLTFCFCTAVKNYTPTAFNSVICQKW